MDQTVSQMMMEIAAMSTVWPVLKSPNINNRTSVIMSIFCVVYLIYVTF